MEASKKRANTIERYNIQKTVYPKQKKGMKSRYDLMEAVIINISKDHDDEHSESKMIQMLTDLFNENIDSKEKVSTLKMKYGISTTVEFEGEVQVMTSFAANLIAKGRTEGRAEVIQKLLEKGQSKEFILELGYSEEEYKKAEQALLTTD